MRASLFAFCGGRSSLLPGSLVCSRGITKEGTGGSTARGERGRGGSVKRCTFQVGILAGTTAKLGSRVARCYSFCHNFFGGGSSPAVRAEGVTDSTGDLGGGLLSTMVGFVTTIRAIICVFF